MASPPFYTQFSVSSILVKADEGAINYDVTASVDGTTSLLCTIFYCMQYRIQLNQRDFLQEWVIYPSWQSPKKNVCSNSYGKWKTVYWNVIWDTLHPQFIWNLLLQSTNGRKECFGKKWKERVYSLATIACLHHETLLPFFHINKKTSMANILQLQVFQKGRFDSPHAKCFNEMVGKENNCIFYVS